MNGYFVVMKLLGGRPYFLLNLSFLLLTTDLIFGS